MTLLVTQDVFFSHPKCKNGDEIEVGGYYRTTDEDYARVVDVDLDSLGLKYLITWVNGEGATQEGYESNFESVFF